MDRPVAVIQRDDQCDEPREHERVLEAALGERGQEFDAFALLETMRATNDARTAHGEELAERLADGVLAREMRQAANHPRAYRGTTHISVIDSDGNAAAASLSNGEGNGFIVGKYGFMLNNMLGEEDLMPEGLGHWRAGTRLSSMTKTCFGTL